MPAVPPWYRQMWPWLLMLMPGLALVGGVITFWLAVSTNHALVVDDYYREGKAINRQLARDALAAQLGLTATVARADDGVAVIHLASQGGAVLPETLSLRVIHATREELDQRHLLRAIGGGRYAAGQGMLPLDGRWHVVLEAGDRSWRLTGLAGGFVQPLRLEPRP